MEIKIKYLLEGAKEAEGLVVIIDVFRAFSNAAYIFGNGAEKIIAVGNLEEAFQLKKDNPSFILMGERDYYKVEGFDYGNSPYEISKVKLEGKTIVLTTSSGTQGINNCKSEMMVGSFVNARATINHIKKLNPKLVTFVALGAGGIERRDEDDLFAEYCKLKLENKEVDFNRIKEHLRNYKSSLKFFNNKDFSEEDFYYCLDLDKFDFVMKVVETKFGKTIVKN